MTQDEYAEFRKKQVLFKIANAGPKASFALKKEEILLMDVATAEAAYAASQGITVAEFHQKARQGDKKVNFAAHYGQNQAQFTKTLHQQMGMGLERSHNGPTCSSFLAVHMDGMRDYDIRCTRARSHVGNHAGRSRIGLTVEWTDAQAREALRPNPIKVVGALTAWRLWRLAKHDYLQSVSAGNLWESAVMTTARKDDGSLMTVRSENPNHGTYNWKEEDHGIHAYKTLKDLLANHEITYPVIGKVALTGRVCEHEHGYRAQIATIQELWYFGPDDPFSMGVQELAIKAMERRYECPVHVVSLHKRNSWFDYMRGETK